MLSSIDSWISLILNLFPQNHLGHDMRVWLEQPFPHLFLQILISYENLEFHDQICQQCAVKGAAGPWSPAKFAHVHTSHTGKGLDQGWTPKSWQNVPWSLTKGEELIRSSCRITSYLLAICTERLSWDGFLLPPRLWWGVRLCVLFPPQNRATEYRRT